MKGDFVVVANLDTSELLDSNCLEQIVVQMTSDVQVFHPWESRKKEARKT